MADVNAAIEVVLRQEDSTLSGVITNIPSDMGGVTRFGITQASAKGLAAQGFFTAAVPADRALVMAKAWYTTNYAAPLFLDQIDSQGVATALLSYAVNQEGPGGSGRAVKLLQEAVASLGDDIVADGVMGPATVAAINHLAAEDELKAFGRLEQEFYDAIVAANPSQAKFIAGWTSRVKQNEDLPS
jgi:lysozyme family protein